MQAGVGNGVGYGVGYGVGISTHSVRPIIESAVHLPYAHTTHSWYTAAFWYLPVGQCRHSVVAKPSAKRPAWQSVHASPVVAWYWPGAQSVHAVAGATAYVPLAHVVHAGALYVVLIDP